MLKLLAHDLDMKDCDKNNAYQCSGYAKKLMIKKYGEANMTEANKSITLTKDVVDNTFIQMNCLLQRMQVNALGKVLKQSKEGI